MRSKFKVMGEEPDSHRGTVCGLVFIPETEGRKSKPGVKIGGPLSQINFGFRVVETITGSSDVKKLDITIEGGRYRALIPEVSEE